MNNTGKQYMPENKAVVFSEQGKVEFQTLPMPALSEGELLIRSQVSQISTGTELTMLLKDVPEDSMWDKMISYPRYPGYSNVGTVEGVGQGVDADFWVGKRVCSWGRHALYFTMSANDKKIAIVPDDISTDAAVFSTIGGIAMNGVRRGGTRWGDAVVVYGAGLIGQHVARYARLCGAMPVFAVDISDFRLGKLPDDKGIIPINSLRDDPAAIVRANTYKDRMADIVFETTGNSKLIPNEFTVLRKLGRMVIVSSPRGITEFDFNDLCSMKSYTIIGAQNASHPETESPDNPWTIQRDINLHFELIKCGLYDPLPLVTHKYPCIDSAGAYQMLVKDRTQAMAVHLDWTVL